MKYELTKNLYMFKTMDEQIEIINYLNESDELGVELTPNYNCESGLIMVDFFEGKISCIKSSDLDFSIDPETITLIPENKLAC